MAYQEYDRPRKEVSPPPPNRLYQKNPDGSETTLAELNSGSFAEVYQDTLVLEETVRRDDGTEVTYCAYGLTAEVGLPPEPGRPSSRGADGVFPRFVLKALAAGYQPVHAPVSAYLGPNEGDPNRPVTRTYFFFEKPAPGRAETPAPEPVEAPLTGVPPASRPTRPVEGETVLLDHSGAPERAANAPGEQTAEHAEKQRVKLLGRVGREPVFRTTRNDVLIARFPVAVREDDDSTTWHQVLAFNERAKKLAGTLTKGQMVEIVGYQHERKTKTTDGKTKTVQEVYAAVIKPR